MRTHSHTLPCARVAFGSERLVEVDMLSQGSFPCEGCRKILDVRILKPKGMFWRGSC